MGKYEPIKNVFIVLTEDQPEPDPSQGFPELFLPPSCTKEKSSSVKNESGQERK